MAIRALNSGLWVRRLPMGDNPVLRGVELKAERLSLTFTAVLASFEVADSLGASSQKTSHG